MGIPQYFIGDARPYCPTLLLGSTPLSMMLTEVTSRMERTQQLTDEVQEQAESRRQTLRTMIDLAGKISASQALLLSGLKDAKHVFGQLEPADDDSLGLHERRDALQVLLVMSAVS